MTERSSAATVEALAKLVDQIDRTNPVDDHGHNFKMNKAFLDAKALIEGPRDYRVCYHHIETPTIRIAYPAQEPLLTFAEAEKEAAVQRTKGWAIAWVIARDGLGGRAPVVTSQPSIPAQQTPAWGGWTPEQFWEYVEGLTDTYTRDCMRDMLTSRGLSFSSPMSPTPREDSHG